MVEIGPFTVLVADDNDVAQRLCKRVLEKAGYKVLIAADGLQAVDVALNQNPSMILMDVAMPGIDGLEATRRLKAAPQTRHIPIVALTAHTMASDRDKALAVGCDDFDTKPIELPRLLEKIETLLSQGHRV